MSHPPPNGIPPSTYNHSDQQRQLQQTPFPSPFFNPSNWPLGLMGHNQNFGTNSWPQSQPAQQNPMPMLPFNMPSLFSHSNHPSFDVASAFPQQFMQEFLRLSTPVGQSPSDDTILVQALHESKANGKTYKQALEGLHGVNNHAANLWKDYYLDHHDRIEMLVSRLSQQPKTVKKPFTDTIASPYARSDASSSHVASKQESTSSPAPPSPKAKGSEQPQRKRTANQRSAQVSAIIRPPKRPRATFNSLTTPTLTANIRGLTPPYADIPVPEPPSRSPTPPNQVQSGVNGNRYTQADRDYFIKFLTWRLKLDPWLTKKQLCDQLAEKVPHHSATSWSSHWHQRHDIADKILATYRETTDSGSGESGSVADSTLHPRKAHLQSPSPGGTETQTDYSDSDANTEDDEADMGEPGTPFTRGDWRMLARFIARSNWHEMAQRERFDMFSESYDTERSAKAWNEFYRRNETALLRLAEGYRERNQDSEDIRTRRARPSWAQKRDAPDLSHAVGAQPEKDEARESEPG